MADPFVPITGLSGLPPNAFIFHHTGGRGDAQGVIDTLRARGLGVQYVMDRDGNITQIGGPGSQHMLSGWGPQGTGLNNGNTVGMEVIARDNNDVTPKQVQAARDFIAQNYPNTPVFGHGEVNPGHKEADEGMSIVSAIRGGGDYSPAAAPSQVAQATPSVAAPSSPADVPTAPQNAP